jgi:fluoride exporter
MYRIALIGAAGLAGTLARYWISGWADERWGTSFPIGTLMVNLTGCLAIGFLFQATQEKYLVDPVTRTAILIGLLGGFTTFSSFGIQTFNMLRDGEIFLATLNVVVSNVGGMILVWAGYALSRSL